MSTVLNVLKLAAIILGGGLFFFGQGWLIINLVLNRAISNKKNPWLSELIPFALLSGVIVNYALTMIIQTVSTSLIIGGMLALTGLTWCIVQLTRRRFVVIHDHFSWVYVAGIMVIDVVILGPIIAEPLQMWDARSIWFFHAKMIYSANSIGQAAGWQHASTSFSHVDYPNLVPVMAAQIMTAAGTWNEYLPKLSIFFTLLPGLFWLLSFARRSFSFAVLTIALLLCFYPAMWDGYMDGILAFYLSISMLLLGRYITSGKLVDILSGACCLIVLPYLKNEGMLALLVGGAVTTAAVILKKKPRFSLAGLAGGWKALMAGLIGLTPLVLWEVYKSQWGIKNSLGIGTTESLERIQNRLQDGSLVLILKSTFAEIEAGLFLLSIVGVVILCWRIASGKAMLPALATAVIYGAGMIVVYLLTPFDLHWHLDTSVSRTLMPVSGTIFVAVYFLLESIENSIAKTRTTPADDLPVT